MDTEFLVQMRQFDKCGSVRNDEIFNLHLGSGTLQENKELNSYRVIQMLSVLLQNWEKDEKFLILEHFLLISPYNNFWYTNATNMNFLHKLHAWKLKN